MRINHDHGRWLALPRIPFKTLGVSDPSSEGAWHINMVRQSGTDANTTEDTSWAAQAGQLTPDNPREYPTMVFENVAPKHAATKWREDYYAQTFEVPAAWASRGELSRLGSWRFRTDPTDHGLLTPTITFGAEVP